MNRPQRRTLGYLLREDSRLLRRRFIRHARRAGLPLNQSEAALLLQVMHEPGINLAGVANLFDIETISVVRLVDGLEEAGLLQRRPHPTDRRIRTLWLTEAGEQIVEEVGKVTERVRAEALAGLSGDDREHLLNTLLAMRMNLLAAAEADDPVPA
jgi:DNA-binding MarR family transcriptional regulator